MRCQFSLEHYQECLELAKDQKYIISPLKDWYSLRNESKFILLRHDVDFSLVYALHMAAFESNIGIHSTYHIMLQSDFYNALSELNIERIKTISLLGHEVGYHLNSKHMIKGEDKILSKITGKDIKTYSRHFPLVSPRLKLFKGRDAMDIKLKYLSDSCRNWREDCLCHNLGKYDKLQVLIHPIWWVSRTNDRKSAIDTLKQDIASENDYHIRQFNSQVGSYMESIENK